MPNNSDDNREILQKQLDKIDSKIDAHLEKIDTKLEKIDIRLGGIDGILILHNENLKEHMKRSLANEKAVAAIVEELKPIQAHVIVVKAVIKGIGWLSASGIILYLIQKFFH